MNDTIEFFKKLGYVEVDRPICCHHGLGEKEFYRELDSRRKTIELIFGDCAGKYGYKAFGFCLVFDLQGKFLGHGAFE